MLLSVNVRHKVDCRAPNLADGMPTLFAGGLVNAIFFQQTEPIGEHPRREREREAVFGKVQAALSFVPFQAHYI